MSPRRHFIRIHTLDLHYLEWGATTKPPLILLHGGAAHAHWWDHIAPVLAQDYRVIAPDLRGHGDSSWTVPAAYEIDDYVADLQGLIAALELEKPVLLGHSLGGFIALAYATARAETLRALIVVDIRARLSSSRLMHLLQAMPAPIYKNEHDLLRRFRLLPAETQASAELFQAIARHSVAAIQDGQDGRFQLKSDRAALTRSPRDLSAQLSSVTCPCLFIRGRDSKTLSAQALAEMLASCPDARGIEIPGASHHVFLDQPEAFLQVVQQFLDERVGT